MEDHSENIDPSQTWRHDDLIYKDIPTKPCPNIGKLLVTGASGYVGGRLVPQLLDRGYKVRIMVREAALSGKARWRGGEVVVADALDKEQLKKALDGIHTAYYLIHSLLLGPKEFETADIKAAINFREAAEEMGVKRIIYLGGLGEATSRSPHLRNRLRVGDELRAGKVPVTTLRAAIIIGSGSASYEIIHHMVMKAPVILVADWARNRCQPIGIRDLTKYLVGVLEVPQTSGKFFDVCGKDILTYELMLKEFSEIIKRKIFFINTFFSNTKIYSYFASFLTPVPAQIIASLFEGLKDEVVCRNDDIKKYVPFEPITYREAIIRALTREEQDEVHTRWSDSYPPAHDLAIKLREIDGEPTFTSSYSLAADKECTEIFWSICRIGGKTGWFNSSWLWKARGMIDRVLMGVGTARGRRSYAMLEVNDVIDFWRVEELQTDRRMLLRAEMKLPGKAWLDFRLNPENGKSRFSITAYFFTKTFFGRIYWYMFLPFHHFIFLDLLKEIVKRARGTKREEGAAKL